MPHSRRIEIGFSIEIGYSLNLDIVKIILGINNNAMVFGKGLNYRNLMPLMFVSYYFPSASANSDIKQPDREMERNESLTRMISAPLTGPI